jgi:hypothetical protein
MKLSIAKITILLFFIAQNSVAQTIKHKIEKLNLSKYLNKIDRYTKEPTLGMQEVITGDTLIKYSRGNQIGIFTYYEENENNGDVVYITGDAVDGYYKEEYNRFSTEIRITQYNSNGIVITTDQLYSENYLKNNPQFIVFPVGIRYEYDSDGVLKNSVDYSLKYKFSYKNLQDFLKKMTPKIVVNMINGLEGSDGYFWEIKYISPKFHACEMKIGASSGAVVQDYHNVQYLNN